MKEFITTCVTAPAELIGEMVDNATELEYSELLEHVTQEYLDEVFPQYRYVPVTLKSDWSVSYWKSEYDGKPCVYVDWSRQEHVFVENN